MICPKCGRGLNGIANEWGVCEGHTKVLVVAAHPDDEAIGCGGTVRLLTRADAIVWSLFLTSGEQGCPGADPEETRVKREKEAESASQILGTAKLWFPHLEDGNLTADSTNIEGFRKMCAEFQPEVIYAPYDQDQHPDHRIACEIVREALTPGDIATKAFMYEVWTPLVDYDEVVDITTVIGEKIAAIRAHRSQVDLMRFDEAAYAMARYHGEMHNRPHGPFAEVFTKLW